MQSPIPPHADALSAPERHAAIRLEGATAGYAEGPDVIVGAAMELKPGATALVTGPAGAGKSTLLHLLRMALIAREGRVSLLGSDVARLDVQSRAHLRRRIGYAAQAPAFLETETLFDNVALPLNLDPRSRQTGQDVMDLLAFLGLSKEAGRRASTLSQSQRKLAALARALVARPDIVLADDPLAGLSGDAEGRVTRLLAELGRLGAAVVIAAQDPVESIAGAVWRIREGRLELSPESRLKPLDPAA